MADILIRGMEMPHECFECPLFTNCDACEGYECGCGLLGGIGYEEDISEDRRRDGCPLVELPEHGDLIDLDERVTKQVYNEYNMEWDMKTKTVRQWLNINVADMPVIIPSNKEETE